MGLLVLTALTETCFDRVGGGWALGVRPASPLLTTALLKVRLYFFSRDSFGIEKLSFYLLAFSLDLALKFLNF